MTVVVSLIRVLESGFPPLGGVAAPPKMLVNLRMNVLFPQPESAAKPITTVFFTGATLQVTTNARRRPSPNPPPLPPLLQQWPFTRIVNVLRLSACVPLLARPLCCPWKCDWSCNWLRGEEEEEVAAAAAAEVHAMAAEFRKVIWERQRQRQRHSSSYRKARWHLQRTGDGAKDWTDWQQRQQQQQRSTPLPHPYPQPYQI